MNDLISLGIIVLILILLIAGTILPEKKRPRPPRIIPQKNLFSFTTMTNEKKTGFTCGRCRQEFQTINDHANCEYKDCWLKNSQVELPKVHVLEDETVLGKKRRRERLLRQMADLSIGSYDKEHLLKDKKKEINASPTEDLCEEDQDIYHPKPFIPFHQRKYPLNQFPLRIGEVGADWEQDPRSGIWRKKRLYNGPDVPLPGANDKPDEWEGDGVSTPFDEIAMAANLREAWQEYNENGSVEDDLVDPRTLN